MKIDFSNKLKGLDGKPLKDSEGKESPLSLICVNALLATDQKEQISGDEHLRRFKLAKRIHEQAEVEVTAEEISLMKQSIAKNYVTLVVGVATEMLENGG